MFAWRLPSTARRTPGCMRYWETAAVVSLLGLDRALDVSTPSSLSSAARSRSREAA